MLETGRDMDPKIDEILQTFVWWGASLCQISIQSQAGIMSKISYIVTKC